MLAVKVLKRAKIILVFPNHAENYTRTVHKAWGRERERGSLFVARCFKHRRLY